MLPRKVALHTSSHLTPIEAWRSAVSTTSEGHRVSTEPRLENCKQVWGWAKFGQRTTHGWDKIALHTCSYLFTTVHTSLTTLFAQWQLLVEFFPCKNCYFSILRAIFLKLHIFAHLIESYPTAHGLSSCVEKNINPSGSPYYSDHVRSSHSVIFCTFECSYSSVLRRILLKLHILTRLIESFPTSYGLWSCIEVKFSSL